MTVYESEKYKQKCTLCYLEGLNPLPFPLISQSIVLSIMLNNILLLHLCAIKNVLVNDVQSGKLYLLLATKYKLYSQVY